MSKTSDIFEKDRRRERRKLARGPRIRRQAFYVCVALAAAKCGLAAVAALSVLIGMFWPDFLEALVLWLIVCDVLLGLAVGAANAVAKRLPKPAGLIAWLTPAFACALMIPTLWLYPSGSVLMDILFALCIFIYLAVPNFFIGRGTLAAVRTFREEKVKKKK